MHAPRVVVITGASAGVGRAAARAFGAQGARVGLIARGAKGLEVARADIDRAGGAGFVAQADVSDPAQVENAAAAIEQHFGPIDVWVNNAMCSVMSPVREMTPEEYQRVTDVTYLGYVYGTLAALRRMLPRNRGMIIQVGSALAYRGIPLQSAYCAAKHAIQGFNDSLRAELLHEHSGVRVTMLQMPALNTPQFGWVRCRLPHPPQPVPPIFQPEVAAQAIVHAARHYRREWYVGWPTVKAIIGNKLFPGLADRYLGRTGYAAQQTEGSVSPARADNLHEPVDEQRDFGAHGDFDTRAQSFSWQLWASQNRTWLVAASAGVLVVAVWLLADAGLLTPVLPA